MNLLVKDIIPFKETTDMRILWENDIGNHNAEDVWNSWDWTNMKECPSYLLDKRVVYMHAETDETLTIGIAI